MATREPITVGAHFGRWTIVCRSDPSPAEGRRYYRCRCICGSEKDVYYRSLVIGLSTSCGCLKRERAYVAPGQKLCRKCRRALPLDAFGLRPDRGPNARRPKCGECSNALRKAKRKAVSLDEQAQALELARRWKRENAQRLRQVKAAWNARNPEKVAEHSRRQGRRFRELYPGVANARARKARLKKGGLVPAWADKFLMQQVYECCAERNRLNTCGVEWQVDHIVPLTSRLVCGLHVQDNLQVIPYIDNIRKGNRYWPDMWPREA